jgi:hypothetical protein
MFGHAGVRAFAACGPSVIWYRTKWRLWEPAAFQPCSCLTVIRPSNGRGAQIAYRPRLSSY